MKKSLIKTLLSLTVISSMAYPLHASAEETINFDGETETYVETKDVSIKKISDEVSNTNSILTPYGAGVWDLIGYENVGKTSKVYPSSGGNYKVIIEQPSYGPYLYSLREKDNDLYQTVDKFNITGKGTYETVFKDIGGYVDGDNKKAEFYIYKSTMTSTKNFIAFYD